MTQLALPTASETPATNGSRNNWGRAEARSYNSGAQRADAPEMGHSMLRPHNSLERRLGHLAALEAESIYILREAAAEFSRPVMLYSIGKDSSVMLRVAQKAFH